MEARKEGPTCPTPMTVALYEYESEVALTGSHIADGDVTVGRRNSTFLLHSPTTSAHTKEVFQEEIKTRFGMITVGCKIPSNSGLVLYYERVFNISKSWKV